MSQGCVFGADLAGRDRTVTNMKKLITTAVLGGLAVSAMTLGAFTGVFTSTYKVKPGGTLDKAKCGICHVGRSAKLNPYGQDMAKAMKAASAKKPTPEILKQLENLDSNGNKVKNIDEIKADKLP